PFNWSLFTFGTFIYVANRTVGNGANAFEVPVGDVGSGFARGVSIARRQRRDQGTTRGLGCFLRSIASWRHGKAIDDRRRDLRRAVVGNNGVRGPFDRCDRGGWPGCGYRCGGWRGRGRHSGRRHYTAAPRSPLLPPSCRQSFVLPEPGGGCDPR